MWKGKDTSTKMGLKYAKRGLSPAIAREFKDKIIERMEQGKFYRDPDFKLDELSKIVGLSRHQTSMILNNEFNQDFKTFINGYRVEGAKIILMKNEDKKLKRYL